jgi:mannose-6-phosphate isomerase-like protein (cupin superfamily)
VKGTLKITLGEEEFQLKPGDSFYFESTVRHRWINPGKSEAVILWINSSSGSLNSRS